MGGMAASGGYWISTPADYIVANPSTLTGSIGIFGVINTVENTLGSIGVHTDGVATSPLADVSSTKALPPEVQQLMQLSIENGYQRFITLVANARKSTPEKIDQIAQWPRLDRGRCQSQRPGRQPRRLRRRGGQSRRAGEAENLAPQLLSGRADLLLDGAG